MHRGALHARIILPVDIVHIVSHVCHIRSDIYCIIQYNILLLHPNGDIAERRSRQLGTTCKVEQFGVYFSLIEST